MHYEWTTEVSPVTNPWEGIFWTVGLGDFYSVQPKATLGWTPTVTGAVVVVESVYSQEEPGAFSLQPASEQRRSVDSQERQEYGTVRESAWHARVR
jgi:hypothetical protein